MMNKEYTANLCPLAGGDAVYKARSMLYMMNDSIYINDYALCRAQGMQYRQSEQTQKPIDQISIYPNPTSDLLNIELSGEHEQNVHFAIYSMQGQLIENGFFKGKRHVLSLHAKQMYSGLYIVRLIVDNKTNYAKKFVYEKP